MSRAFTKEDDAGEDLPERPVPAGPNYVTSRGLELLKQEGQRLAERKKNAQPGEDLRPIERDLRYLEARVTSAIVVPPGSGDEVRFGASVTIRNEKGEQKTFMLVGDDEARTDESFLSWSSPLAMEMFGLKAGDQFAWSRMEEIEHYKIIAVSFPPSNRPDHL